MKSIISSTNYCFICGYPKTEEHHIFNGSANRKKSEEDGMKIRLCHRCHMRLHDYPQINRKMKEFGQRKWEEVYGNREAFIARYGKSYL